MKFLKDNFLCSNCLKKPPYDDFLTNENYCLVFRCQHCMTFNEDCSSLSKKWAKWFSELLEAGGYDFKERIPYILISEPDETGEYGEWCKTHYNSIDRIGLE